MKNKAIFILGLIIITILAAFLLLKKPLILVNNREDLAAQLIPLSQHFFDNLAKGSYQEATSNFTDQMKQEMPPEELESLHNQINDRVGPLVSLGNPQISKEGNSWILEYQAAFTKEETVLIRLIFTQENANYKIAGLWLDSPKLRN
ncbi:MAG: DUF3887 domain-containing protein [Patescibacteria group bacterium]|jgi:hypothetical protein